MDNNFEIARQLLSNSDSQKISSKKKELSALASSSDGQNVKNMLDGKVDIEKALAKGDVDSIKKAISEIMATESGARLINNLGQIMK